MSVHHHAKVEHQQANQHCGDVGRPQHDVSHAIATLVHGVNHLVFELALFLHGEAGLFEKIFVAHALEDSQGGETHRCNRLCDVGVEEPLSVLLRVFEDHPKEGTAAGQCHGGPHRVESLEFSQDAETDEGAQDEHACVHLHTAAARPHFHFD